MNDGWAYALKVIALLTAGTVTVGLVFAALVAWIDGKVNRQPTGESQDG